MTSRLYIVTSLLHADLIYAYHFSIAIIGFMTKQSKILIIDDDKKIRELVADLLERNGFSTITSADGRDLPRLLREHTIDVILLDIMLPGESGTDICKKLRQHSDIPIIMLTAMDDDTDQIVGLEIGADDYITKPFNPRQLIARIRALLRRSKGELRQQRLTPLAKLTFANWILDREQHCLLSADKIAIPLSSSEFKLLITFLEHPKRILTREQLMDLVYDKELQPFDRTIDVQVGRLRKKIEVNPKKPKLLITVRNGGYKLNCSVEKQ